VGPVSTKAAETSVGRMRSREAPGARFKWPSARRTCLAKFAAKAALQDGGVRVLSTRSTWPSARSGTEAVLPSRILPRAFRSLDACRSCGKPRVGDVACAADDVADHDG